MNVCQRIANICNINEEHVSSEGFSCRSVWKPLHSYHGTLYRENEHVIVVKTNGQGEMVGRIKEIFTIAIRGAFSTFLTVQAYSYVDDCPDIPQNVVKKYNFSEIIPLSNLSRKVMLYTPVEGICGATGNLYIVVDYMRRIFPISEDLVVIPYYPVINDMVNIQGDEEVWKARVVKFSIENKIIRGIFFHQQNDYWVPESTRVQDISFKSILGFSNGEWIREFSIWKAE